MTSGDGAYRIAEVATAVVIGFLVMVLLVAIAGLFSTEERTGAACVKLCAPLPVKEVRPTYHTWCVCETGP